MYQYNEIMVVIGAATAVIVGGTWLAVTLIKGGK